MLFRITFGCCVWLLVLLVCLVRVALLCCYGFVGITDFLWGLVFWLLRAFVLRCVVT